MTARHQVDTPFVAGRCAWPEIPMLRLADTTAEITLFVAGPDVALVEAVASGTLRCSWIGSTGGALLCISVLTDGQAVLPWTAIPYHAGYDMHDRLGPTAIVSAGQALPVTLLLVDAATGLTAAVAEHTWPAAAVTVLRKTLARLGHGDTPASHAATALSALRREYGSDAAGVDAMIRDRRACVWQTRPE